LLQLTTFVNLASLRDLIILRFILDSIKLMLYKNLSIVDKQRCAQVDNLLI